jgi:hypothetical protein
MQTVIKAHSSADFIALVPALLGFVPRNSVVLVAFRGKRTHGILRSDLPTSTTTAVAKKVATNLIGTMCKIRGAESIAVVIYTDEPSASKRPRSDLASILKRRIEQSGFGVHDSLCQAADGWFSYLDPEKEVHALEEVSESPIALEIPESRRPQPVLAERVPNADDLTMARVRKELNSLHKLSHRGGGRYGEAMAETNDYPMFVEMALVWTNEEFAERDALFIWCLMSPPIRDQTMLQWATDLQTGDRLFDENEKTFEDIMDYDPDLAGIMMGKGPRPDVERVETAIALMEKIVARCDDRFRPAPLSMLAWLNWAIGKNSIAQAHVNEARRIDPDYGMAELIDTMLYNGMFPEWAFDG